MKIELTPEEEKIIKRIECSREGDHLIYDLSLLLPCFMIIGIGAWYSQAIIIIAGAFTYFIFRILTLTRQSKSTAHLRSAIEKLKRQAMSSKTESI